MRELILGMSMSLDGFVCGLGGQANWMFSGDQEAIGWKVQNAWNSSLHIMGSRSFAMMAPYWPTATDVFAAPMNQTPKAVFSKQGPAILKGGATAVQKLKDSGTELQPGADSWATAYVASGDLVEEINRLKAAGDGKPMFAFGGAAFARSLIAHDLVDEYVLLVYPIILGKGLSIFTDVPAERPLKLVSSKRFPLGSVAQTYRRS